MAAKNNKLKPVAKKTNVDLKVDEDIEIDDDLSIDEKVNIPHDQVELPVKPRTLKPAIAGYLLIFAFILNLLLPINFIYFIYDAETATGDTSLSGKVLGEDDVPVDNVTVQILDLNLSTKTNTKGKFSFDNIPVGEHDVLFSKPGFREIKVHKVLFSKHLLKNVGETDNIINIPGQIQNIYIPNFDGPFNTTYSVNDDLNRTIQGFIHNTTGSPIAGVQIEVQGSGSTQSNKSTYSDDFGRYILTNCTPGIVRLRLTHGPGSNRTLNTFLFASNKSLN